MDPSSYKFRLFIEMETGDVRYRDKINCGMWVGSGMRKGSEVIYEYVILLPPPGNEWRFNLTSAYRLS